MTCAWYYWNFTFCCICFKEINEDTCWSDEKGQKWDMCISCGEEENDHEEVPGEPPLPGTPSDP